MREREIKKIYIFYIIDDMMWQLNYINNKLDVFIINRLTTHL